MNTINVRKAWPMNRDDADDAPDTTIVIGGEVAGAIIVLGNMLTADTITDEGGQL